VAKDFLDKKGLSTVDGKLDLMRYSIAEAIKFDAYSDKDVFTAVVLTVAKEMTVTEGATHGTATKLKSAQQASGVNYKLKVRILGENSPHKYLPDPLDPSFINGPASERYGDSWRDSIVSLHTTVTARYSLNVTPPAQGDIIEVRLPKNGTGNAPNMQMGEYQRGISGQGIGGSNFNESGGSPLVNNFQYLEEGGALPGQSSRGGTKDDPTFEKCRPSIYPDLPKKPTRFFSYSRQQVLNAVNSTVSNRDLRKTMWAFLNKEQPGFKFPANNVAGIQLDNKRGFSGTKKSDFDYQTCFLDSGNEQRIFAGFDTLEKGITAFSKIIEKKMARGYKKLAGNSVSEDAETLTWNYYSNWNTQLTKTELVQLKATGRIVRDGTVIERNWNSTVTQFRNSLLALQPDYGGATAASEELGESDTGGYDDEFGESEA